jgi:cell division protein FtsN
MKRNLFLMLGLATLLVACSKKYYPEMYQRAGEDALVVVKTEKDTTLHAPVLPADTLLQADTINVTQTAEQVVDAIVEKATIRETNDTYTSGGVAVQQQYHVVVGSFQSEVNAQNLQITLQKQGFDAMVAVNQNGLFRVFMYSADTEVEIRKALAKARVTYPDAWMLKIAK